MSGDIASVCRANSQSAASPSPTSGAGRLRGAFRLFSSHPWRPEVPLVLGGPENQFLGMPWVCRGTKICRRKISGQRPIGAPPPQSSPRPALEGLCRGVCSVYIYIYTLHTPRHSPSRAGLGELWGGGAPMGRCPEIFRRQILVPRHTHGIPKN